MFATSIRLLLLTCVLGALGRIPLNVRHDKPPSATADDEAEVLHTRTFFYAGGEYVYNETVKGEIWVNKQYVEELTPAEVKHPYPIVFFHGGGDSGVVCPSLPHSCAPNRLKEYKR